MKESTLFRQFHAIDKNFELVNRRIKELSDDIDHLAQTRVQDYLKVEATLRILRRWRLRWILGLTTKRIKKTSQKIVEEIKQKQIEAAERERIEKEKAEKEKEKIEKSGYNQPPKEEHRPQKPTPPPPPKEVVGYSGA